MNRTCDFTVLTTETAFKLTQSGYSQMACLIHGLKFNCRTVDGMIFGPELIHQMNLGLLLEFMRFLRTTIDVTVNQMANSSCKFTPN